MASSYNWDDNTSLEQITTELSAKYCSQSNYEELICDDLMEFITTTFQSQNDQENTIIKYANKAASDIKGFSDMRDCYCDITPFFTTAIARYSITVMQACAKVCSILHSTEQVEEWYRASWAEACLDKSESLLENIDVMDVPTISKICDTIDIIAASGFEYEDLISARTNLGQVLQRVHSVLSADKDDNKNKNKLLQKLKRTQALCVSGPDKLAMLESSIDMSALEVKQAGKTLLDAYNLMCDENDEHLQLQVNATKGGLTSAAFYIIDTENEGNESENIIQSLLDALVFVQLLVLPFSALHGDETHLKTKREIAEVLRSKGVISLMMKHMIFWAVEWSGCYGDCGRPVFLVLSQLCDFFPEEVTELLKHQPKVVEMLQACPVGMSSYGGVTEYSSARNILFHMGLGDRVEIAVNPPHAFMFGGF